MLHSTEKLTESSYRLTDVLITPEIGTRPPRTPDLSAEHAALQQLASGLKGEPEALLQQLTELACVLCGADAAGVSCAHGDEFRWLSVAGTYSRYAGLAMPRSQSPCGICLERADAQLFTAPERYFAPLAAVSPPIAELLILPLCTGDATLSATLWIASDNVQHRFDAEDLRVLTALAGFAAAALRIRQADAENRPPFYTEPPISESKAQEALARLEAILNTVADGIISTDEHGRIESVNRAAERIFGYPAAALLGNNISMLMPESESSVHDNYLQRYLNSGKRIDSNGIRREVMGRRCDGSVFPLELALSEPRLTGRRLFTGILRDITERKQAEAALRENEEFGRQIIASIQEGLAVFDRELRYRVWNRYMEQLSGISAAEVQGKHPDEIFPWMREQGIVNYLERSLAGESLRHPDTEARHSRTGRSVYVSAKTGPLHNAQGEIVGVVAILQDITERKRAEDEITRHLQELRCANEDLARFNRAAVDRELRIVELKKQVNELCVQHGQAQRYRVDFDEHTPLGEP